MCHYIEHQHWLYQWTWTRTVVFYIIRPGVVHYYPRVLVLQIHWYNIITSSYIKASDHCSLHTVNRKWYRRHLLGDPGDQSRDWLQSPGCTILIPTVTLGISMEHNTMQYTGEYVYVVWQGEFHSKRIMINFVYAFLSSQIRCQNL